MKSNSLALTIVLLVSMLVVGALSGAGAFAFGRKALQGITQPAVSPVLRGSVKNKATKGVTFLKEQDILKKVDARTGSSTETPSKKK